MSKIQLSFTNEFSGIMKTDNGDLKIGRGEFLPYPLLMGALGSCLYSTFIDTVKKMRLDFTSCDLDIEYEKRDEVPKTCKLVVIKVKIVGADPEKKERLQHAFKLATEYCSIYNTLSQVSEMQYELDFE